MTHANIALMLLLLQVSLSGATADTLEMLAVEAFSFSYTNLADIEINKRHWHGDLFFFSWGFEFVCPNRSACIFSIYVIGVVRGEGEAQVRIDRLVSV